MFHAGLAICLCNVIECYMAKDKKAGGASVATPPASPSPTTSTTAKWEVIITEWALDAYLNLKHGQVFTDQEYWGTIQPDVELLRDGLPSPHPKFTSSAFWGPAKQGNVVLQSGHKMKWRNVGPGQIQLRLPVMVGTQRVFLCEAYVKSNALVDQRKLARFKTHMNLISQGRYKFRGSL